MADNIRSQQLLDAAMNGDIKLMKEMKKVNNPKSSNSNLPETVDGAVGQDEVVDKFKEVYYDLYNSAESSEAVELIKIKLNETIGEGSLSEVNKITPDVVKKAVSKMKPNKTDVSGSYSSDLLIHSPDLIFEELASVFWELDASWLGPGLELLVTQTISSSLPRAGVQQLPC